MIYGQPITLGGGKSPFPSFSYTGRYGLLDDGDGNWRIKFLSSGVFTPDKDMSVDVFLVGGGGGGACTSNAYYGGGGGGGYTATHRSVELVGGTAYAVAIGAGGSPRVDGGTAERGNAGGSTSFADFTVDGGLGGLCRPYSPSSTVTVYADGGSGGAGYQGIGGSDGGAGGGDYAGSGQGTTTREFGESDAPLYAGGGGCGSGSSTSSVGYAGGEGGGGMGASYGTKTSASPGEPNTGGGGGGGCATRYVGGYGGCGVVVIRNTRAA